RRFHYHAEIVPRRAVVTGFHRPNFWRGQIHFRRLWMCPGTDAGWFEMLPPVKRAILMLPRSLDPAPSIGRFVVFTTRVNCLEMVQVRASAAPRVAGRVENVKCIAVPMCWVIAVTLTRFVRRGAIRAAKLKHCRLAHLHPGQF